MHWLEFFAYFLVMLTVFTIIWFALEWLIDKIDERRDRHFREKVDRYRRGHR